MNQVQNISFHGQTVPVFTKNNQHYVAMKPICENIGLDWSAQYQKIKRNAVLNSRIVMTTIRGEDGKPRENLCLPLSFLNGWLFGVDANRVKTEIRERLIQYQAECFEVLNAHFNRPIQQPRIQPPSVAEQLPTRDQLMQMVCMYENRLREIHNWGGGNIKDYHHKKFGKLPVEATYSELVQIIRRLHADTSTPWGAPIVQTMPEPEIKETFIWLLHYAQTAAALLNHTAAAVAPLNPGKAAQMRLAANRCIAHVEIAQQDYGIDDSKNVMYTAIPWSAPPDEAEAYIEKLL